MQLLLTNMGPVPVPIAAEGGWADMLECGMRVPVVRPDGEVLMGAKPAEPALGLRNATPDNIIAYTTYVDAWVGRSDVVAKKIPVQMGVDVLVESFDGEATITTDEGPITIPTGGSARVQAINYATVVVTGSATGGSGGPPPPITVEITGFTATFDTTATAADTAMLDADEIITLTAVAGTPEAMALIEGASGTITNLTGTTFQIIGLDLTGVDVTDLAATGTVEVVQDLTGTITAFTAANPTVVTMDVEDQGLLITGDVVMLEALTGDPAAMALVNGSAATVMAVVPSVQLGLDLTGANVAGLTADFTLI